MEGLERIVGMADKLKEKRKAEEMTTKYMLITAATGYANAELALEVTANLYNEVDDLLGAYLVAGLLRDMNYLKGEKTEIEKLFEDPKEKIKEHILKTWDLEEYKKGKEWYADTMAEIIATGVKKKQPLFLAYLSKEVAKTYTPNVESVKAAYKELQNDVSQWLKELTKINATKNEVSRNEEMDKNERSKRLEQLENNYREYISKLENVLKREIEIARKLVEAETAYRMLKERR